MSNVSVSGNDSNMRNYSNGLKRFMLMPKIKYTMKSIIALLCLRLINGSKVNIGIPRGRYTLVDYGSEHPLTILQNDFSKSRRLSDFDHSYEPIRIHMRWSDINPESYTAMTTTGFAPSLEATNLLIQKVIIPAAAFLESTVRIVRARSPLHMNLERPFLYELNCFTRNITASKDFIQQGGVHVSNADLVVNVRAHEQGYPNAQSCLYDQFDRATFGT
jgi:hypothetical protein